MPRGHGVWVRPGLMVVGLGLLVAVAATTLMEIRGPVRGIWMSPALSIAIGMIAGAGALAGLYPRLEPHAPRLAERAPGWQW